MAEESRSFINDVVNHLCTLGYIGKNTEYGSIFMTELANDILFGGVTVTMKFKEEWRVPKSDKSASVSEKTVTDSGLYEHLRKLRMEIANEQGVPAYIVFTNATLADMAAKSRWICRNFSAFRASENKRREHTARGLFAR